MPVFIFDVPYVCEPTLVHTNLTTVAILLHTRGILAQLGEHLPYKQRVIGSSPIGPIQNPLDEIRFCADMAQLAEQLICNQQVNGSSPFIGFWWKHHMDGFPSGQRGQTVNLLQIASVVRIHLRPLA